MINKKYSILDANLVNNIYDKKINNINNYCNDIMNDYIKLLKDIKINCVIDENNNFNNFLKFDLNISQSIIEYINSHIQKKINIRKLEIERQIENNENELLSSEVINIFNNKNIELDEKFYYLIK